MYQLEQRKNLQDIQLSDCFIFNDYFNYNDHSVYLQQVDADYIRYMYANNCRIAVLNIISNLNPIRAPFSGNARMPIKYVNNLQSS